MNTIEQREFDSHSPERFSNKRGITLMQHDILAWDSIEYHGTEDETGLHLIVTSEGETLEVDDDWIDALGEDRENESGDDTLIII